MGFIARAWRGEERLWKVFWLYTVLGGAVFNALVNEVAGILAVDPLILVPLILLPFSLWSLVSCWRCAFNVSSRVWGIVARIFVVLGAIGYLMGFLGMVSASFLVAPQYRQAADACATTFQQCIQESKGIGKFLGYVPECDRKFDACFDKNISSSKSSEIFDGRETQEGL